jgi:hypothetical protein
MRLLWASLTLITTLVMAVWSAWRGFYVCMVEGFALTIDILQDKQ